MRIHVPVWLEQRRIDGAEYANAEYAEYAEYTHCVVAPEDLFRTRCAALSAGRSTGSTYDVPAGRAYTADLIYVSVSVFGDTRSWGAHDGFEPLDQAVRGVAVTDGGNGRPRVGPTCLLDDYLMSYPGAAGVMNLEQWIHQ